MTLTYTAHCLTCAWTATDPGADNAAARHAVDGHATCVHGRPA